MSSSTEGLCGRPGQGRRSKKREAILVAARALFGAEGYSASVDAIAARAGVSKATVYAHFPSKHELFAEVLRNASEHYIKLSDDLLDLPVEEGLGILARQFVDLVTMPEALTIFRAIVTQGAEFPEMVEAWQAGGPRRVISAVVRYFTVQDAKGTLRVPDPHLTTLLFLHSVKGDIHMARLCGMPEWYGDSERLLDEAVRMIIATYGPGHMSE